MIEDTLTKTAMSSLKIAGAVLTGAMTVLLWVAVIEILDCSGVNRSLGDGSVKLT